MLRATVAKGRQSVCQLTSQPIWRQLLDSPPVNHNLAAGRRDAPHLLENFVVQRHHLTFGRSNLVADDHSSRHLEKPGGLVWSPRGVSTPGRCQRSSCTPPNGEKSSCAECQTCSGRTCVASTSKCVPERPNHAATGHGQNGRHADPDCRRLQQSRLPVPAATEGAAANDAPPARRPTQERGRSGAWGV